MVLPGYIGMGEFTATSGYVPPNVSHPDALGGNPYVYLIPCGNDSMRAPTGGGGVRSWTVQDQAIPLPYNLGGTQLSSGGFFSATGSLTEQPWVTRKHQSFRAFDTAEPYLGRIPWEYTNTRLIGRSVWNSRWKIVIPASSLGSPLNANESFKRFTRSVKDIQLFLRTYSHSGNQ